MEDKEKPKNKVFSIIFIILALILIFVGINKKEYEIYFRKAVNICTQCIGIG
ncbi:MAG: hypothetical protein IKO19_02635 [Candidatus Riflebacteria bacterium]|nr:hypothetical protein [Candidatus Riflebacteria bacterium]